MDQFDFLLQQIANRVNFAGEQRMRNNHKYAHNLLMEAFALERNGRRQFKNFPKPINLYREFDIMYPRLDQEISRIDDKEPKYIDLDDKGKTATPFSGDFN